MLWCTEVPEDAVLAVLIAELAIERSSLMTDQQTRKRSKMSTKIRKPSRKKIREAVQQGLTQREMASQWRVSVAIVRKWLRETPGSGYIPGKRGQRARPSVSVEQAGPREMPEDIKTAFSGIKEQRVSRVADIERIGEEFATAQ